MAVWDLSSPGFSFECETPNPLPAHQADLEACIIAMEAWKTKMPLTMSITFTKDTGDPNRYKFRIQAGASRVWRQDYFIITGDEPEIEFLNIVGLWKYSEFALIAPIRDRCMALAVAPNLCTRIQAVWS